MCCHPPQSAAKHKKTILLLYDPSPGLKSSINLADMRSSVPDDLAFLFAQAATAPIAVPTGSGDVRALDDSIKLVLQAGGFAELYC